MMHIILRRCLAFAHLTVVIRRLLGRTDRGDLPARMLSARHHLAGGIIIMLIWSIAGALRAYRR